MKNPRRLVMFSLAAFLVVLAAGLWALVSEPWVQKQRLPNGTVLRLEAVTYGSHDIPRRSWWRRLLEPRRPPSGGPVLQTLPGSPWHSPNGIVFWLSHERPLGRQKAWAGEPLSQWTETVDERGARVGPLPHSGSGGYSDFSSMRFVWIDAFPRRGETVRLRFPDRETGLPLAEFTTPNPTPGPHPVWAAEPFPVRGRNGPLEVEMLDLVTGLHDLTDSPVGPGRPGASRAAFRLRAGGEATTEWEPVEATLRDATGNVLPCVQTRAARSGDLSRFYFAGSLDPAEVWKLDVGFARTARARFLPEETWILRGLAVPKPGERTERPAAATIQGVKLRFLALAPADSVWYQPRVFVRVDSPMDGRFLTVLARDERGREFAGYDPYYYSRQQTQGQLGTFYLNLPPDSRRLDLTFAVQQSRRIEFTAQPLAGGEASGLGERP
jgi:hypothetical protein